MASVTVDWGMEMHGARQYMPALPSEWLTPTMETFEGLTEKEAKSLFEAAKTYTGAIGTPNQSPGTRADNLEIAHKAKEFIESFRGLEETYEERTKEIARNILKSLNMTSIIVDTEAGTCKLDETGISWIRGNIPRQPVAIVWPRKPYHYATYSSHAVPELLKEEFEIPSHYKLWLLEKAATGRPENEGPDPHAIHMVHTGVAWD